MCAIEQEKEIINSGFDEVTNYEKWEKPRSKCDPCGTVFVDGGHDYLRRGFKNGMDDYEELSIVEDEEN